MMTCPHCGADPGYDTFCAHCGNRVAGRGPGLLARRIVLLVAVLLGLLVLIAAAVLGLCGALLTVVALGDWQYSAGLMLYAAVIVAVAWGCFKLGSWILRAGQASTTGDRTRWFGTRAGKR